MLPGLSVAVTALDGWASAMYALAVDVEGEFSGNWSTVVDRSALAGCTSALLAHAVDVEEDIDGNWAPLQGQETLGDVSRLTAACVLLIRGNEASVAMPHRLTPRCHSTYPLTPQSVPQLYTRSMHTFLHDDASTVHIGIIL